MMKKTGVLFSLVMIVLFSTAITGNAQEKPISQNLNKYHFCHRCGMAIEKSDKVMTVAGVPEAPWYQCCPMCALMDIIESGKGKGIINATCDQSEGKVKIVVDSYQISTTTPENAIMLVGGSCPKNKIFIDRPNALQFIKKTRWAKEDMLKPVAKTFSMLKKKKKALTRCAMCATALQGHEKTTGTIITNNKERMLACCSHCLLFAMYKLKDKAKRATTPDFKTVRLVDAKKVYYVVGNDLVVCCYPSTISFEKLEDAKDFQRQHAGEILTFQAAIANIKRVMKEGSSN